MRKIGIVRSDIATEFSGSVSKDVFWITDDSSQELTTLETASVVSRILARRCFRPFIGLKPSFLAVRDIIRVRSGARLSGLRFGSSGGRRFRCSTNLPIGETATAGFGESREVA